MIYGENSPEAKKKKKKREQTSGQGLPLTGEQGETHLAQKSVTQKQA